MSWVKDEVIAQLLRGVPVSLSSLGRRCLDVMSVAVVGHLGSSSMAAAAVASSTTNTIALSVFVGLSSATTTLVSQAVGAGDHDQAGLWLHRALIVHAACAVPLTLLLTLLTPLLRALHFEEQLASDAGVYCALMLPGVWMWAAIWALTPWLQAHGIVRPQMWIAAVVAALHPMYLYLLVVVADLGLFGAAIAGSLSLTSNLAMLSLTILLCLRSTVPLLSPRRSSASRLGAFLRLGLPGVGMMGEWWASEISILVSGLLPRPTLALSAISVYQSVNAVCFMLPLGASVAGATRVGAALGRGDGVAARRAACVCVLLGLSFSFTLTLFLLANRRAVAAVFTTDDELRHVIWHDLLPPLSIYIVADACQCCCGGVLQGCGRQRDGLPLVLGSYYLFGLPLACFLGFMAGWGVRGMVSGMLCAKLCHAALYAVLVLRTDWARQVREAAERVRSERAGAVVDDVTTAIDPSDGNGNGRGGDLGRGDMGHGDIGRHPSSTGVALVPADKAASAPRLAREFGSARELESALADSVGGEAAEGSGCVACPLDKRTRARLPVRRPPTSRRPSTSSEASGVASGRRLPSGVPSGPRPRALRYAQLEEEEAKDRDLE